MKTTILIIIGIMLVNCTHNINECRQITENWTYGDYVPEECR